MNKSALDFATKIGKFYFWGMLFTAFNYILMNMYERPFSCQQQFSVGLSY